MRTGIFVVFLLMVAGCEDKAAPDYADCLKFKAAGNIRAAYDACLAAYFKDRTSRAGKAADEINEKELGPILRKLDAEETARKEANAKMEAEALEARVKQLQGKIHKKYWGLEPDGQCTGKGLPPYKWDYEGGTYEEDALVASADHCTKLTYSAEIQTYCCSQSPLGM